ncbi:uncharacterized protein N7506_012413 [Penicillium brevicompactum]|uniref:uncharacterized protein n=1 Tax=Penicillium brevicompactum TaxID=5074 RepID=UPI0025407848|nr:uncharacterized protein N7506_012413 [Penicillium brevicompactum]KAJ5319709.1 hypothetical protein N7506_012413 [Penicillium brevicompactum]
MVVALCSTSAPGKSPAATVLPLPARSRPPYTGKVDGPRPHRCGDRSPGAFWCPASLESVDHWPLAIPDTQIPGGEPPRGIRRSSACPRGPDPSPEDHMPQPDSARKGGLNGTPACGLVLRGLVGGNWMVVHVFPVRRGCRCDRTPRASLPFNYILPPGGSGPPVLSAL